MRVTLFHDGVPVHTGYVRRYHPNDGVTFTDGAEYPVSMRGRHWRLRKTPEV